MNAPSRPLETPDLRIRAASAADAAAVAAIYNHYVAVTCVTFEIEPIATRDMIERITEVLDAGLPWLLAEDAAGAAGFAYASKWKGRRAYRFSVESTVYLHRGHTGRGIGRALYGRLLEEIRARRLHAVIGGIALPNAASVALHERLGFRKVAHFEQVGYKQDRWIDVGYWQLLL